MSLKAWRGPVTREKCKRRVRDGAGVSVLIRALFLGGFIEPSAGTDKPHKRRIAFKKVTKKAGMVGLLMRPQNLLTGSPQLRSTLASKSAGG
jgi:hypothetical protein